MNFLTKDLRKRTRVVSFRPWPEDAKRWDGMRIPMGEKTRAFRSAFHSLIEVLEEAKKGVKIGSKPVGEVAE